MRKPTKPEETQIDTPAPEILSLGKDLIICQEWKGEFVNGAFQKTRMVRDNVKLRQETIDEMNSACNPMNPFMYLKA